MKLVVLAAGRPKDRNVAALAGGYIGRVVPKGIAGMEFAEAGSPEREGAFVLRRLRERDTVVLLDERGEMYDSEGFAGFLSRSLSEAEGRLLLVVGGAFGFSDELRRRADGMLSLSRMTMPHELCLLFLSEQIYRAFSIMAGTDYHHG